MHLRAAVHIMKCGRPSSKSYWKNLHMHGADQRMSQPEAMKTNAYIGGVEKVNGHDAWALFKACATGDMARVKALLAKDRRLINAQIYYYQFPIHMAARAGHTEIVKLLLDEGVEPISWGQALVVARERGHRQIERLILRAMGKNLNMRPSSMRSSSRSSRGIRERSAPSCGGSQTW
jgi:hypothetical protein